MKIEKANNIHLPDVVGKGYGTFWRFKGRYRVVKGSRASKKSKTTALYYIWAMMKYPEANLLVVRKVFRTLKDSCFTELKWAINRLGVANQWDVKESPLEMTYKPTGQKIYFRGLDDPLKVTSITVEKGFLCWMWIEEGYEIMKEDDFDMLNESIRGAIPKGTGLFKQVTITFNPWNEKHWLKHKFFDDYVGEDSDGKKIYRPRSSLISEDKQILAITTNYLCNEWLDSADRIVFDSMKKNNPKRYRVAGLGNWGVVDGLIYENWVEQVFDVGEIKESFPCYYGLDFGYSNDPTAFWCGAVDEKNKLIYVFDEIYKTGMSNEDIHEAVLWAGYAKENITADNAEPKSIARLNTLGLHGVSGARKGKDSVKVGIDFIQGYKIIIHPRCVNFSTEIGLYSWAEDKFGKKLNVPEDANNHLMDAMRYALEGVLVGDNFSFD